MQSPLYCCVIFHTSSTHVPRYGMNPVLLSMSVEREIKERLATEWKCQEFIYLGNTLLIVELEMEEKIAELTDACDRFCRWAYRIMGSCNRRIGRTRVIVCFISIFSYEGARERCLTEFCMERNVRSVSERLCRRNRI